MGAISNFFTRALHFIRYDLWRPTVHENGKPHSFGRITLKTIILSVQGYQEDKINDKADALTYSMLFAIVPIIAIIFAIAKGFGFGNVIEEKLQNVTFLQELDLVPTIMGMVERYLETAQSGVFVGVGILVLLWAVYSFFNSIESSFNDIWSVKKSRNVLRQFTTYIVIVLMIPVLIVCTSGISVFVNSSIPDLPLFATMAPIKEYLLKIFPFVVCWIIFSTLYWAIPNTKVGFWAAVVPGVLIGTCFQLLQMLSVYLIAFLGRTSIVYGTFAAIPLLLTWLRYSCLMIFVGAELSYAIQNNEYYDYQTDMENMSRRYKDYLTLYIVYVIVKNFEHNEEPLSAHDIAQRNHLPIRLVNNLTGRLLETKILREIYVEGKEDKTFMPAMDIHQLTVAKVFISIDKQGSELFLQNPTKEMQIFWERWNEIDQTPVDTNTLLIKDLLL